MSNFSAKSDSPYLAASAALRSEYERLAHANQMMRHSMIAMAIAVVLSSALGLYLARKPRVLPYVIELDKAGEVTGLLQPLAANQSENESVIRFELARFITDARSVLSDGAAEKAALHRVYDMARGEAATVLPSWSATMRHSSSRASRRFRPRSSRDCRSPAGPTRCGGQKRRGI